MAIGAVGVVGAFLGAGVTYWAAWRQTPKPDVRIDGVALMYVSLNDGDNTFKAKITNHGSAVVRLSERRCKPQ